MPRAVLVASVRLRQLSAAGFQLLIDYSVPGCFIITPITAAEVLLAQIRSYSFEALSLPNGNERYRSESGGTNDAGGRLPALDLIKASSHPAILSYRSGKLKYHNK